MGSNDWHPEEWEGRCIARNDPKGLGRIRVEVPGIFVPPDYSDWIRPYGLLDSFEGRGFFVVPKVKANVIIKFLEGYARDSRWTRYIAGPWGEPDEGPDVPQEATVGAQRGHPDIVVMGFEGFALVVDERDGQSKATLVDRNTGSTIAMDTVLGNLDVLSTNKTTVAGKGKLAKLELEATGKATLTAETTAILTGALMKIGINAKEAAVLGTTFMSLFNGHPHIMTAGGLSGPPTTPMLPGTHTSLVTTME